MVVTVIRDYDCHDDLCCFVCFCGKALCVSELWGDMGGPRADAHTSNSGIANTDVEVARAGAMWMSARRA